MAKFEQTMTELGFTPETVGKGIQGLMKTYYKGLKEVESLEADLQNMGDDDETKADLQSSINSIREDLEDVDRDLVKKIKGYHENKDFYDAKIQYLKDKSAGLDVKAPTKNDFKKVENPSKTVATPPAQPAPQAQPIVAASGAAVAQAATFNPEPISVKAEVINDEPKKKGSGNWILWVGLGIVGLLVGVNVVRNRE